MRPLKIPYQVVSKKVQRFRLRMLARAGSHKPPLVILLTLAWALLHITFPAAAVPQAKSKQVEAHQVPRSQVAPPRSQMRALGREPGNTGKLFAATREGLELSEDGGRSWRSVLIDGKREEVFALSVHPVNPDTLFAGRRDGLWKSYDGGKSWNALPYPASVPMSVAIARSQPDTIYLATSRRGVHKSADGGYQWVERSKGLPDARAGGRPEEIHNLVIDPSDSDRVYAGIPRHGIYRTLDGGAGWQPFNQNLARSVTQAVLAPKLAFDPDDPKHLYLVFNERIHSRLIRTRLYLLAENLEWLTVEAKLPTNFLILDLAVDSTKQTLQLWGSDAVWELPLPRNGTP